VADEQERIRQLEMELVMARARQAQPPDFPPRGRPASPQDGEVQLGTGSPQSYVQPSHGVIPPWALKQPPTPGMPPAQMRAGAGVPITELAVPKPNRMTRDEAAAGFQALDEAMQQPPPVGPLPPPVVPDTPDRDKDREVRDALQDDEMDRLLQQEVQAELEAIFGTGREGRERREKYKEWVETNAESLNWETLILHGEARQRVRINDRITVTFRSLTPGDTQDILEMLYQATGSPMYLQDRLGFMQLAASLYSYEDPKTQMVLPAFRSNGQFVKEGFLKRLDFILERPLRFISLIQLNGKWFDDRVRKLSLPEVLGNG